MLSRGQQREKLKCYLTPFGCVKKKVLTRRGLCPPAQVCALGPPSSSAKHCLVQVEEGSTTETHCHGAERTEGWTCRCSAALQRDSKLKARRITQETVGHHKEMRHQWRKQC